MESETSSVINPKLDAQLMKAIDEYNENEEKKLNKLLQLSITQYNRTLEKVKVKSILEEKKKKALEKRLNEIWLHKKSSLLTKQLQQAEVSNRMKSTQTKPQTGLARTTYDLSSNSLSIQNNTSNNYYNTMIPHAPPPSLVTTHTVNSLASQSPRRTPERPTTFSPSKNSKTAFTGRSRKLIDSSLTMAMVGMNISAIQGLLFTIKLSIHLLSALIITFLINYI